ncbi:MAG TPA: exodeoxyribonuclease VII large subunit [Geobacteraceae bacterium]|nr:exodeoxyribonuclease VII large subunit [Geobacteraceae bacterium]
MNLFADKKILTVSQLTTLVRGVLEENFEHVWVEGEVSNLSTPTSGHLYFTLKDSGAALRCVMFRGSAKALRFRPADGMKLIVRGRMTVYDQRGDYQLLVEYLEPQGVGALQLAFQQLKERLAREGLFAEERKRALPLLPRTIGIVTSPTGAAIHDIFNVLERRHAGLHILVAPVKVQGEGASEEIAAAVRELGSYPGVDVIIVARGGGSLEDLWAFNEEAVARAIYAAKVPVVSAIGHEVDFTIADFVADLRAPTPSAAAELVVMSKSQLMADCTALERRLRQAVLQRLTSARGDLQLLQRSLKGPDLVIVRLQQRVDDLSQRSEAMIEMSLAETRQKLLHLQTRLQHGSPLYRVRTVEDRLANLDLRCRRAMRSALDAFRSRLARDSATLEALSPLSVLARGYAVVEKLPSRRAVKSIRQLQPGDRLKLQFTDGEASCGVEGITPRELEMLDSTLPRG